MGGPLSTPVPVHFRGTSCAVLPWDRAALWWRCAHKTLASGPGTRGALSPAHRVPELRTYVTRGRRRRTTGSPPPRTEVGHRQSGPQELTRCWERV